MAYSNLTPIYKIPYPASGDVLTSADEAQVATIIENQLRGALIASGQTRIFEEGTYAVTIDGANIATVTLTGGPSVRGISGSGFVESFQVQTWAALNPGSFYYLYVQSTTSTYLYPSSVTAISSIFPITSPYYLYLATLDNTVAGSPVLDTMPAGKPTGQNLYDFLNSATNPFGLGLSQQNITAVSNLIVLLASTGMIRVTQANAGSSTALIYIDNDAADAPEINSLNKFELETASVARFFIDNAGLFGLNVDDPEAAVQYLFNILAAANVGIKIKAAAAQTANLLEVCNSAGTVLSSIDKDGNFVFRNYTDVTRPAFGTAGRVIFNTNDGKLNVDTVAGWTLPDGTPT